MADPVRVISSGWKVVFGWREVKGLALSWRGDRGNTKHGAGVGNTWRQKIPNPEFHFDKSRV